MTQRSARVSLVAALAALVGLTNLADARPAEAQVAAKVESQTRPNFGLLLDPPANARRRPHRNYRYRDHRPDWRPDWDSGWRPGYPGRPGGDSLVTVDCGGNPGSGAVEDAVRRVAPGGTLVIRSRGGPCVGWLNVDKPMTIQGEGGYDPRTGRAAPPATLQAPNGAPCITVARGVRLQVQSLNLVSPRGGDSACIVGEDAEILLQGVAFNHAGDEAAIYVRGGVLDIRNSTMEADTTSAAIIADGTSLTAQTLSVHGAQSGIELTPAGAPSKLYGVTLLGANTLTNFGPRALGLVIRSQRQLAEVEVNRVKICGYAEALAIEGAAVVVRDSRICKADRGVVLYSGELNMTGSRIRADALGLAAIAGRAVVTGNSFANVREVFRVEDRAVLEATDNRLWSRQMCRAVYRPMFRDRYAPYWDDRGASGYTCQFSAYPQSWWSEDEGALGLAYQNESYAPQGYDAYQAGYGWYDRGGSYVDDRRFYGDERWSLRDPPRRPRPQARRPDRRCERYRADRYSYERCRREGYRDPYDDGRRY